MGDPFLAAGSSPIVTMAGVFDQGSSQRLRLMERV